MSEVRAQVALLHGSGLETIGGEARPSRATARIAELGAQILRAREVEHLILSGRGPVPSNIPATEAGLMADLLIRAGIHHSLLVPDETSTSTLGNWVNSADIIEQYGDKVIGVGRRLQIPRARVLGKFVASKSPVGFEIVGYHGVPEETPAEVVLGIGQEAVLLSFTAVFMERNKQTPLGELNEAYDVMKKSFGLQAFKNRMHHTA